METLNDRKMKLEIGFSKEFWQGVSEVYCHEGYLLVGFQYF